MRKPDIPLAVPQASDILSALFTRAGGHSTFVDEWHNQFEQLRRDRPGSKLVLDHYRDLARLVAQVNAAEASRLDIASMDEEQTREFITQQVLAAAIRAQCKRHGFVIRDGRVVDARGGDDFDFDENNEE